MISPWTMYKQKNQKSQKIKKTSAHNGKFSKHSKEQNQQIQQITNNQNNLQQIEKLKDNSKNSNKNKLNKNSIKSQSYKIKKQSNQVILRQDKEILSNIILPYDYTQNYNKQKNSFKQHEIKNNVLLKNTIIQNDDKNKQTLCYQQVKLIDKNIQDIHKSSLQLAKNIQSQSLNRSREFLKNVVQGYPSYQYDNDPYVYYRASNNPLIKNNQKNSLCQAQNWLYQEKRSIFNKYNNVLVLRYIKMALRNEDIFERQMDENIITIMKKISPELFPRMNPEQELLQRLLRAEQQKMMKRQNKRQQLKNIERSKSKKKSEIVYENSQKQTLIKTYDMLKQYKTQQIKGHKNILYLLQTDIQKSSIIKYPNNLNSINKGSSSNNIRSLLQQQEKKVSTINLLHEEPPKERLIYTNEKQSVINSVLKKGKQSLSPKSRKNGNNVDISNNKDENSEKQSKIQIETKDQSKCSNIQKNQNKLIERKIFIKGFLYQPLNKSQQKEEKTQEQQTSNYENLKKKQDLKSRQVIKNLIQNHIAAKHQQRHQKNEKINENSSKKVSKHKHKKINNNLMIINKMTKKSTTNHLLELITSNIMISNNLKTENENKQKWSRSKSQNNYLIKEGIGLVDRLFNKKDKIKRNNSFKINSQFQKLPSINSSKQYLKNSKQFKTHQSSKNQQKIQDFNFLTQRKKGSKFDSDRLKLINGQSNNTPNIDLDFHKFQINNSKQNILYQKELNNINVSIQFKQGLIISSNQSLINSISMNKSSQKFSDHNILQQLKTKVQQNSKIKKYQLKI